MADSGIRMIGLGALGYDAAPVVQQGHRREVPQGGDGYSRLHSREARGVHGAQIIRG